MLKAMFMSLAFVMMYSCNQPIPPGPHGVKLTWRASTTPQIANYKIYRGLATGGPYSPIATVATLTFLDQGVQTKQTYYYVATATKANLESKYSNEFKIQLP